MTYSQNKCESRQRALRAPRAIRSALRLGVALGLIMVFAMPEVVEACPTCKEGLANEHHDGWQEGFYWSILFMMSMPFLILGGLSTLFYLSIRRAKRAAELSLASGS